VNNTSGSGTYTIYRDTKAPSGSIVIDGGVPSTNSTTASLKLSATNPTSGDPVSDMAFSVDGGAFGVFQPFATSASVSIPATEGAHTVSVEYRNGAGVVSSRTAASIYLVKAAPTVTSTSPSAGSTAGGNTVTVHGTHFAPGSVVKFTTADGTDTTFVNS